MWFLLLSLPLTAAGGGCIIALLGQDCELMDAIVVGTGNVQVVQSQQFVVVVVQENGVHFSLVRRIVGRSSSVHPIVVRALGSFFFSQQGLQNGPIFRRMSGGKMVAVQRLVVVVVVMMVSKEVVCSTIVVVKTAVATAVVPEMISIVVVVVIVVP